MHYRNGREAKNRDFIVSKPGFGPPVIGILYNAVAGNDSCNWRLAIPRSDDPYTNLAECLHVDDANLDGIKTPIDTGYNRVA